mgnify:CR=1 FL=1
MFIQRGHKQLPTQVRVIFCVHAFRNSFATHMQANVRLVPTDLKYPTVASMVQVRALSCTGLSAMNDLFAFSQDMEARRDIAENLVNFGAYRF